MLKSHRKIGASTVSQAGSADAGTWLVVKLHTNKCKSVFSFPQIRGELKAGAGAYHTNHFHTLTTSIYTYWYVIQLLACAVPAPYSVELPPDPQPIT